MAGFIREIKRKDKNGKEYSYWVAVKSYRDKKTGKVRHKLLQTFGRLTEKEVENLLTLKHLKELGKDAIVTSWEGIKVRASYEYLSIKVLDRVFKLWELWKIFDKEEKRLVNWVDILEIVVINRALCPNSDYKVRWWYQRTILPKILNISPDLVNPTRIYRCLDQVYIKEEQIQRHLMEKISQLGYDDLSLIFYDITSSYFEGGNCSLAEYGLSRDKRKDKKQLLLALAVTKQGYPFYWKVLPGSLHDCLTVKELINCLKERFNLKNIIVIMDKGMVSEENLSFLEENNFWYIVTIGRNQIKKLSDFPYSLLKELQDKLEEESKKQKPDLKKIIEKYSYFKYFSDRAYWHQLESVENRRYILCFNPEKFLEERQQRQEKIKSIQEYLIKWNKNLLSSKSSKNKKQLEKQIYSYLKKRKAESLFIIKLVPKRIKKKITTYQIEFDVNQKKLERLKICDGIYCILTNLPEDKLPEFLIGAYRERRKVENAFHYLKGFIDIRPFYHQNQERIKAHITICIIAYLIQITIENLLKKRNYYVSFQEFISQLVNNNAVEIEIENLKKKEIKFPEIPEQINELLEGLK